MKQQLMISPGDIIFRDIAIPEVNENQVKIKMMCIGI